MDREKGSGGSPLHGTQAENQLGVALQYGPAGTVIASQVDS